MFRSLLAFSVLSGMFCACASNNLRGRTASGSTPNAPPAEETPAAVPGPQPQDQPAIGVPPVPKAPPPFPALVDCQSAAAITYCGLASLAADLKSVPTLNNSQTMKGVVLPKGDRNEQSFQDVTIDASCLSNNSFISSQWDHAVFKGSEMITTELSRTKWTSAQFIDSDLRLSHFAFAEFHGLDIKNSCLSAINWSASTFENVTIDHSFGERANFSAMVADGPFQFTRGALTSSNFSAAVFNGPVSFRDSDLRGINFSNAQFKSTVDWQGAQLSGATWMDGRVCAAGSVGECK